MCLHEQSRLHSKQWLNNVLTLVTSAILTTVLTLKLEFAETLHQMSTLVEIA